MSYIVHRSSVPVALAAAPDQSVWQQAEAVTLDCFRPESKGFRPRTTVRMLYDKTGLYGLFEVEDQYVRTAAENLHDQVCLDSCVEFFVTPNTREGYCNFEFSANGTKLAYCIHDNRRIPGKGFADYRPLTPEEAGKIEVFHTLSGKVAVDTPVTWRLGFALPFELICDLCRSGYPETGTIWRGNFYKCGDRTPYPHWASLFPVSALNFHLPECFGQLIFN